MRKHVLVASLMLALLGLSDRGYGASPTATDLIEKLHRLEKKYSAEPQSDKQRLVQEIILQMGDTGDENVKPILKKYMTQSASRRLSTTAGAAQVALAKFDDAAFEEVQKELSAAKSVRTQEEAFTKLGMIGNRKAVLVLGGYLKDDSAPAVSETEAGNPPPPGTRRQGIIKSFPRSILAAQALAEIVKDRPTETKPDFYTEKDVKKWYEWWEKSKSRYQ